MNTLTTVFVLLKIPTTATAKSDEEDAGLFKDFDLMWTAFAILTISYTLERSYKDTDTKQAALLQCRKCMQNENVPAALLSLLPTAPMQVAVAGA